MRELGGERGHGADRRVPSEVGEGWKGDLPEPSWSSERSSAALSRQRRARAVCCRYSTEASLAGLGPPGSGGYVFRNWPSSLRRFHSSAVEKALFFSRMES